VDVEDRAAMDADARQVAAVLLPGFGEGLIDGGEDC
jgi:hypothetical protein